MTAPTPAFDRGPDRRQENRGGPAGAERRHLADRRLENNRQYSTFRIGKSSFVLDIAHILEVIKPMPLTPVPLSVPLVSGLINLRGQIIPAVDLRLFMGLPGFDPETAMNLVVQTEVGAYSLLVDEVYDIIDISPTLLLPTPPNVPAALRAFVGGVCKQPDGLLLLLDLAGVARVVESAVQSP